MKPKQAWILVLLAGLLFVAIWFIERPLERQPGPLISLPRLLEGFVPTNIHRIEIRREAMLIEAARTNQHWVLQYPENGEANTQLINQFLNYLEVLPPPIFIPAEQVNQHPKGAAEFGFSNPTATLQLIGKSGRVQLVIGTTNGAGEFVYLQRIGMPGLFACPAELLEFIPDSPSVWRNRNLLRLTRNDFDRLEVKTGSRKFELFWDGMPNGGWWIQHRRMRADPTKVHQFLNQLQDWSIAKFLPPPSPSELAAVGLDSPVAELSWSLSSNVVATLHIGRPDSVQTNLLHARWLGASNMVLVASRPMETLNGPADEWLDRNPFRLDPQSVTRIEVAAESKFQLVRSPPTGRWQVDDGETFPADLAIVQYWLGAVKQIGVTNFVTDLASDLAEFNLSPPQREWKFYGTNGSSTPQLMQHLHFGLKDEGIFARIGQEDPIYQIDASQFVRLPSQSWQLRDRRFWSFTTNEVIKLVLKRGDKQRELIRNSEQQWSFAPGSQGVINPFGVEEALFELGRLTAEAWAGRGQEMLDRSKLSDPNRIEVHLKSQGGAPQVFSLDIYPPAPGSYPVAVVKLEKDVPWLFLISPKIYFDRFESYLFLPPSSTIPPAKVAASVPGA